MAFNKEVDLIIEDEKFKNNADAVIEKASQEMEQKSEISNIVEQIKREGVVEMDGKTYKAVDTGNGLEMTEVIIKDGEVSPEWGETKVLKYEELDKQPIEVKSRKDTENKIDDKIEKRKSDIESKEERLTKLMGELAALKTSRELMHNQGDLDKIDIDPETVKEINKTIDEYNANIKLLEEDLKKAEDKYNFNIGFKEKFAS